MAMAIDRCTLLVTLEEMAMAELDKDEHSTVARGIELAIQAVISEPDIRGLSLNTLRDAIYEDAVAHGLFEDFDRIKNPVRKRRALAMRIMEEAAELYAAAEQHGGRRGFRQKSNGRTWKHEQGDSDRQPDARS